MDDNQLLRYSRHIMLPQLGIEGQKTLHAAHAMIIGLGGLGSPAAMYLAASGIGRLTLIDADKVELSNLQRQIVHHTEDIGRPKPVSANNKLKALNPECEIDLITQRFGDDDTFDLISHCDIVLDCTDNFETRFLINDACFKHQKPLVSAAAIRWEGQLTVFDPRNAESPCYRCLYKDEGEAQETCSETGVLAPSVGTIGSLQAVETIKVLCGIGEPLIGRLLIVDTLTQHWREIKLQKDPACTHCGKQ